MLVQSDEICEIIAIACVFAIDVWMKLQSWKLHFFGVAFCDAIAKACKIDHAIDDIVSADDIDTSLDAEKYFSIGSNVGYKTTVSILTFWHQSIVRIVNAVGSHLIDNTYFVWQYKVMSNMNIAIEYCIGIETYHGGDRCIFTLQSMIN